MAYLNSSAITVDAILTKHGRKTLAQGGGLNITKFALGDTGTDYKQFNVDHPSGSNFYGTAITSLPQIEAATSDFTNLRYTLLTWDRDKSYIPKLVLDKSEVTITEQGFEGEQRIFVKTKHAPPETYTIRILRANGLILNQAPNVTDLGGATREFHHLMGVDKDVAVGPVTEIKLQAGPILEAQATAILIYGDTTGASAAVKVNMSKNVLELGS